MNQINICNNIIFPCYNQNLNQNIMTQFNAIGGNWRAPYGNNNININFSPQQKNDEKYTIFFRTGSGLQTTIVMEKNKTVSHLILVYLTKVGIPNVFNQPEKVSFIFNAKTIKMDCQEKIKDFFSNCTATFPVIVVVDIHNLIGA